MSLKLAATFLQINRYWFSRILREKSRWSISVKHLEKFYMKLLRNITNLFSTSCTLDVDGKIFLVKLNFHIFSSFLLKNKTIKMKGCGFRPRTRDFQLIILVICLHSGRLISAAERSSQVEQQHGFARIHPEFNTCDSSFPSNGKNRGARWCDSIKRDAGKMFFHHLLVWVAAMFSIFFFLPYLCHFPSAEKENLDLKRENISLVSSLSDFTQQ